MINVFEAVAKTGRLVILPSFNLIKKFQLTVQQNYVRNIGHVIWFHQAWSSLVGGDKGSFLPNRQMNLNIVCQELSIFFDIYLMQQLNTWDDMSLHLLLLKSSKLELLVKQSFWEK